MPERPDHVEQVGRDEQGRTGDLQRLRRAEPEEEANEEAAHEESKVALERREVDAARERLRPAVAVDQHADERHCDRREQEGSADDCPRRHVVGPRFASDDRDDRDQRLGKRRRDRGEDAPHGALAKVELAPEPLDPIRKEQRSREQNREARGKENGRAHGATSAP